MRYESNPLIISCNVNKLMIAFCAFDDGFPFLQKYPITQDDKIICII